MMDHKRPFPRNDDFPVADNVFHVHPVDISGHMAYCHKRLAVYICP